jgi:hypothetical protein
MPGRVSFVWAAQVAEVENCQCRSDKDALRACVPLVPPGGVEHADCAVKNMFLSLCPCVGHEQGRVRPHFPDDRNKRALAEGHTGRKERRT